MSKCEQCIVRQFSSLKTLNKAELLRMADSKTSYVIKKGAPVFEEGETVNGIFCIKDGVCKLSKLSSNGKDQIVKLVKPGELLGQRSMISDEVANLSAVALEDMEVCFIPKAEILGFFNHNNDFSMDVMKNICIDLKDADEHMVSMAQKTVKERLAEILLYLEDTFGKNEDQSLRIQLSREELAGMVGTATESCIRLLSEFNKDNLIHIIGKKITILQRSALVKLAQ
ncbi:Crp/Fnr family transcriptional regulator [Flavobacterium psychrophilum]|uniref:Crp/Fnr family transcriptional regulator n=1 Tax=Flavobacterium psychrophilum TaxID=96345 RepID=UPI000B64CD58|nr:Crp/Fnr family transcriptional regulator [Flavobacterium psychrophilum]EKT3957374.1 Crp/Fnr family transcriptional regulator [Flavobacterium psychrophilum]EKT3963685.1 Crp/Fnr family transcriptional regulator [Flavobacterium psychrophilum]EKT3965761.1 Crp/Fnr family transcriptional regulator [Flavobacterium psychrophilum]EKT4509417.1 Crp/Fnr family transcriptional regulator [Flavobacterium psychrophilum]EKT4517154.1 Crp/Fnr family transcriptional regulator [Flavobacterium psychrophilum]